MALEQTIEGVTTNPFRIIQATTKLGPDAISVENTDASFGVVAQVVGPSKTIMDTGYFPANELVGLIHVDAVFYSSVADDDILTMDIWRKNSTGYEEIVATRSEPFQDDISDEFGEAFGTRYHERNNQYRFVFTSGSGNAATTTVGMDYIKIYTMDTWTAQAHVQRSGSGTGTGAPLAYTVDAAYVQLATTGFAGYTYTFTTGYDMTYAIITLSCATTTDMPLMAVTAKTSTGFSVYLQPAGGGKFVGNTTVYTHIMFVNNVTKI